jgi:uncharacterized protein YjdB
MAINRVSSRVDSGRRELGARITNYHIPSADREGDVPPTLLFLSITSPISLPMSLAIGATVQISAVVTDGAGTVISTVRPDAWHSSNDSIATVDGSGLVRAIAAGTASITASLGSIASNALGVIVTMVVDLVPASVTVTPATMTLQQGAPQPIQATIANAAGTALAISPTSWTSSDPTKATVSATGVVTWVAAGSTNIAAHYNALDSNNCAVTAVVDVTAASAVVSPSTLTLQTGAPQTLTATIKNVSGAVLALSPTSWTSSAPAIATVNSSGVVTWVAQGTTNVAAHYNAIVSNNCVVTAAPDVAAVTAASVAVSPTTMTVVNGAPQQLTAVIKNAAGTALALSPTSWTSSDPTKATVNGSGLVTWAAAGSTNVAAHYNALVSNNCAVTAAVDVDTIAASVVISPTTLSLQSGAPQTLNAVIKNASGTALALTPTSWTSSDPSKATVNSTGLVTWVAAGSTNVAAHYNTLDSNNCVVTAVAVVDNTPASVTVSPTSITLQQGVTQTLSAVIKNAAGGALAFTPTSWTSSDTGKATVNSSGVVTWVAAGSTNVAAHYNALVSNDCVVTAAAGGGGGALYPNEPTGFTPISPLLSGDAVPPTQDVYVPGSANDIGWIQGPVITQVTDTAIPVGSTNVLNIGYPAGMFGGIAPGKTWTYQFPTNPQLWPLHPKQIYASYWYKVSPTFPANLNANKMCYFVEGSSSGVTAGEAISGISASADYKLVNGAVVFDPNGATPYTAAMWPALAFQGDTGLDGDPVNSKVLYPNTISGNPTLWPQMIRGQWHHIEIHFVANTTGNYDGTGKMWLDGLLVVDYTNRLRFSSTAPVWQWGTWWPVYGGGGQIPTDAGDNQYHRLKNLYISGKAT